VRRNRLQKLASDAEARRSVYTVGNGTRGREPGLRSFARNVGGEKVSITSRAVAKPHRKGKPEPDVRKGVAGQRFSLNGRHSGAPTDPHRSRDRVLWSPSAALERRVTRERCPSRGRGDRSVRGSVRTRHVRRTTPGVANPTGTCSPPKRIALTSNQAISSAARACKRSTHREPARRGYGYEET